MLAHVAASKMQADRTGNLLEVDESLAPSTEGRANLTDTWTTDLGGLDHLFRDPFTSLQHAVSVPLEKATMAIQGPHGGLTPSYLTHVVSAARVDGQEILAADGGGKPETVGAGATGPTSSHLWTVGSVDNTIQSWASKLRNLVRV